MLSHTLLIAKKSHEDKPVCIQICQNLKKLLAFLNLAISIIPTLLWRQSPSVSGGGSHSFLSTCSIRRAHCSADSRCCLSPVVSFLPSHLWRYLSANFDGQKSCYSKITVGQITWIYFEIQGIDMDMMLLLLSHFSRVQLCVTHRRQPTRLPSPWDSPGRNTGVGCHFLLQCMKVKSESEVAQSCLTLRDPLDCILPGSSVHGIFQARVLE